MQIEDIYMPPRDYADFTISLRDKRYHVHRHYLATLCKVVRELPLPRSASSTEFRDLPLPLDFSVSYDLFARFLCYLYEPSVPMFVTPEEMEAIIKQTTAHSNKPCFLWRMRMTTEEREVDAVIMSESQWKEKVSAFDYANNACSCNLVEFEGVVHCARFFDCPSLLDRIQDRLSPPLAAISDKVNDDQECDKLWKLYQTIDKYKLEKLRP